MTANAARGRSKRPKNGASLKAAVHRQVGKYCPVCRVHKAPEDFHRDPSNSDMMHSCCRVCKRERKRSNRQMTKDAQQLKDLTVMSGKQSDGEWSPAPRGQPRQHLNIAHTLEAGKLAHAPASAQHSAEQAVPQSMYQAATEQLGWQYQYQGSFGRNGILDSVNALHEGGQPATNQVLPGMQYQSRRGDFKRGGQRVPQSTAATSAMRASVIDSFRQAAQQVAHEQTQPTLVGNSANWRPSPPSSDSATSDTSLVAAHIAQGERFRVPLSSSASELSLWQSSHGVSAQHSAMRGDRDSGMISSSEIMRPGLDQYLSRGYAAQSVYSRLQVAPEPSRKQGFFTNATKAAVTCDEDRYASCTRACVRCGGMEEVSCEDNSGLCKHCIRATVSVSPSKYCGSCYESKEERCFGTDPFSPDSLQEYCRECMHVPEDEVTTFVMTKCSKVRDWTPETQRSGKAKRRKVKGEIATSEDVKHCSRCGCRTGTAFQLDSGNLLGMASVCRCDPFIYPTPFSGACSLHELAHVAVESTRQAEAFEASATALHSLQSKMARRPVVQEAMRLGMKLLMTELMIAMVPWLASQTGGVVDYNTLTLAQKLGAGLLLSHLTISLHSNST